MNYQKIINTLNKCIEQDLSTRFHDEIQSIYKNEYIDLDLYPCELAEMLNIDEEDLEYPLNQNITGSIYLNIKYGYEEPIKETEYCPAYPGGKYIDKCEIKNIIFNFPEKEDYDVPLPENVDLYDLEKTIETFLIDNYEEEN